MSPLYTAILLRHDVLGHHPHETKPQVTSLLVRHVEEALREQGVAFTGIRSVSSYVVVETRGLEDAARVVGRVFGVVTVSYVAITPASMNEVLSLGLAVARERLTEGCAFSVVAEGIGTPDFRSQEISEKLTEFILESLPELELRVDHSSPQRTISFEILDDQVYFLGDTFKGIGGLPTGSESKVVCTISSGLDSPVASYKVMKRGCVPIFVHFDNTPFSDESNKELAIRQAKRLAEYVHGSEVKMYIVPHGDDLVEVLKHGPRKLTCVLCRRNMYRLAQEIALREGADAIVTGEIIGEQASQTTQNLRAERDAICEIPILRPCIGDDKVEIEALARAIGTYEFASEAVSCCTLPPKYPTVRARPEDVQEAEKKMDMDWISAEVSQAEVIILKDGPKQ
ncbi:MAG: tRNA sulfurtransferase [Candidatus Thorarchaeota archaeon]